MNIVVLDPSVPFADKVNKELIEAQALSFPATYDEFLKQKSGDPLIGTLIPGTNILWEDSTETQGLLWEACEESGNIPTNLADILVANPGPNLYWNWSYSDFGLIPGKPSKLNEKLVIDPKSGNLLIGIIVP